MESAKHKLITEKLALVFNGERVVLGKRLQEGKKNPRSGKYYPDVKNHDTDFEVVHITKEKQVLQRKALKWDKTRKKALVFALSDEDLSLFDNVYIYHEGKLIPIKGRYI